LERREEERGEKKDGNEVSCEGKEKKAIQEFTAGRRFLIYDKGGS